MMTKQHFEAIAQILHDVRAETEQMFRDGIINAEEAAHRDLAVTSVSTKFQKFAREDNPRFNSTAFVVASNPVLR